MTDEPCSLIRQMNTTRNADDGTRWRQWRSRPSWPVVMVVDLNLDPQIWKESLRVGGNGGYGLGVGNLSDSCGIGYGGRQRTTAAEVEVDTGMATKTQHVHLITISAVGAAFGLAIEFNNLLEFKINSYQSIKFVE
ncbi:hypothetical protein RJ639_025564 [Escallonia herrerae]|uniref:Uncharacterized protein n=1 Tax=Escallonia herrerae TaxID=1293975 RepID=A0AA88RUB8_9ASTE|nr:hypothetical protein RJ639_025564 [Escallonia herrerae]